jgi:hypothetical protein
MQVENAYDRTKKDNTELPVFRFDRFFDALCSLMIAAPLYVLPSAFKSAYIVDRNAYFAQRPKEFLTDSRLSLTLGPESSVHSSPGLGCVSTPLVAQVAIAKGIPWPQFYYGSMVISGLKFAFLLLMYWPRRTAYGCENQKEGI